MSESKNVTILLSKIYDLRNLQFQLSIWRLTEKKIVFTNGCFDLLHPGHIHYLAKAKELGAILIVGVNTDDSVKRLEKGSSRPFQNENSRALLVASLHLVDAVIIFDEDTPAELIKNIQPDILVKGADYDATEKNPSSKKYIAGSDFVLAKGGKVITIELEQGFSTTAIEKKIRGES